MIKNVLGKKIHISDEFSFQSSVVTYSYLALFDFCV